MSTTAVNGMNHIAISTSDMKSQLQFFSDVLGMKLVALFWMHGVPGGFHAFLQMGDSQYSVVYLPENPSDVQMGITHAGSGAGTSTTGTMQHLAFNVDTLDDLLAMRDRIRSRNVQVMGPIDHGMCQSIYFAGPDGMSLEVATHCEIEPDEWIDPEVTELCGISADELAAMRNPEPFERPAEPVAQPATDPAMPQMRFPGQDDQAYEDMITTPDAIVWEHASFTDPPVPKTKP